MKLGPDFTTRGKEIVHRPTSTKMVLVPGGAFTMGFTIDDIRSVWQAVAEESPIGPYVERSRPAHVVAIAPFLLARSLAVGEDDKVTGKAALAAAKKAGLRLPSEAEWEWVAREGGRVRFTSVPAKAHPLLAGKAEGKWNHGPNAFGIDDLLDGELVADALHDTYAGAPTDGSAWGEKAEVGRWGHIWWQDDIEVCSLHAAIRASQKGEPSRYRFAASVPGAKRPKLPKLVLAATMKETLAGFTAKDPLPSIRTLETLLTITIHDDTRALLAALPPILAKMKSGREDAVRVLADAAERSRPLAKLLAGYKLPIAEEPVTNAPSTTPAAGGPQSAMGGRTADRRNCADDARGPKKGKASWKVRVGKTITAPVIGVDGTLYVGVSDGRLCALAPKDGKKLWSLRGKGAVLAAPAIAPDGTIWFGTDKGQLYGIPPSGDASKRIELALKDPLTTSPAIAPDGTVYVTTQRGPLFAVRDGKIAWQYATKPNGSLGVPPAIGEGGVVYFCSDNAIHALDPAGKRIWVHEVPSPEWVIVGRDGTIYGVASDVFALDPKKGTRLWAMARLKINENLWGRCGGISQDASGSLYLSSTSSDACVHVLSDKDGKPKRKLQANNWIHAPATHDADGRVFFGSLMNMYAFDAKGERLWHAPIDGRLTGSLALAKNGTLYGGTDRGVLHAFGGA